MKNIKKIAVLMAVLLVAISILAMVSSCGGTTEETTPSQNNTDAPNNNGTGNTGNSNTDNTTNSQPSQGGNTDTPQNPGDNTDNPGTGDVTDGSTNDPTDSSTNGGGTDVPAPEEDVVKVTVINRETGKGIANAAIQICQGETCFMPIMTDANGVCKRPGSAEEGQLKAKLLSITGVADFMASDEYIYFDEDSNELTIYVAKIVINVFDDKERAVEGAEIQLTQGENVYKNKIMTDADGVAFAYIALDGGEISAKVTSVFGGGYNLSGAEVVFEEYSYDNTIVIKKNSTYTVRVVDMHGKGFAGAQVKLYADGFFEDIATTNENGIVSFENLGEGEYSVEIIITSPAYKVISAEGDNKFTFNENKTVEVFVVESPEITYTVNVIGGGSGLVIDIYNIDNEYVTSAVTDENGVATFVAKNGFYTAVLNSETYAKPASFVRDDSAVGTITVTDKVPGSSQDTPIILLGTVTIDVNAGQKVWFTVPNGNNKLVWFEKDNIKVNYSGMEFTGGSPIYLIETTGYSALFAVTSADATALTVELKTPGTINQPIDTTVGITENGNYLAGLDIENDRTVYYSYTATVNGTITVICDERIEVYFNGMEVGLVLEGGKHLCPVLAGETVIVSFKCEDFNYESYNSTAEIIFGEEKINYTAYVSVENGSSEGLTVILYKKNGENYVEVARGTVNADGQYVFEDIVYAGNYVIMIEEYPIGYTAEYDYVEFCASDYAFFYVTSIKTGEADAPFEFDTTNELKETADVKENGTVWYTLYVRPNYSASYYITANSSNVVIKVYNSDTNDDGIIDENDTPVGVSTIVNGVATYTFGANDMFYTIAVSTIDKQAESVELVYASTELEAGATEDNAIEITEGGEYVAEVSAGATVYYVFAVNDSCKLTVTLEGEANLMQLEKSMDDSSLTDVENNILVIEDTMYTWIYFAIEAQESGSYSFTVTVE